jgi:hypothetical protein
MLRRRRDSNSRQRMSATEMVAVDRKRPRARTKRPRSAVTSGRKLFVDGDPNSAWSRRYHDLVGGHVSDLGGKDRLSEAQLSLIRRASAIELELEQMEGQLSMGGQGRPRRVHPFRVASAAYLRNAGHRTQAARRDGCACRSRRHGGRGFAFRTCRYPNRRHRRKTHRRPSY